MSTFHVALRYHADHTYDVLQAGMTFSQAQQMAKRLPQYPHLHHIIICRDAETCQVCQTSIPSDDKYCELCTEAMLVDMAAQWEHNVAASNGLY